MCVCVQGETKDCKKRKGSKGMILTNEVNLRRERVEGE